MNKTKALPVLYSLRNCPYAMRARIAVFKAKQAVLLRDVVLTNKPQEMLIASPKGTVPVLVLANGMVIDESLAVMLWALTKTDPDNLMHSDVDGHIDDKADNVLAEMLMLIHEFDHDFTACLDKYKCAKRYRKANSREDNIVQCREACELYIQQLEHRLTKHLFLISDRESLADIALLPFIRQFARVERQWYLKSPYSKVKQWLNHYLQSPMFTKVMTKYPLWLDNHDVIIFENANI